MSGGTDPGWYPDPLGRHENRYWDGATWTPNVSDGGVTSTDPLPGAPPQPAQTAPYPGAAPPGTGGAAPRGFPVVPVVIGAVVAVAVVIGLVLFVGGGDDDDGGVVAGGDGTTEDGTAGDGTPADDGTAGDGTPADDGTAGDGTPADDGTAGDGTPGDDGTPADDGTSDNGTTGGGGGEVFGTSRVTVDDTTLVHVVRLALSRWEGIRYRVVPLSPGIDPVIILAADVETAEQIEDLASIELSDMFSEGETILSDAYSEVFSDVYSDPGLSLPFSPGEFLEVIYTDSNGSDEGEADWFVAPGEGDYVLLVFEYYADPAEFELTIERWDERMDFADGEYFSEYEYMFDEPFFSDDAFFSDIGSLGGS